MWMVDSLCVVMDKGKALHILLTEVTQKRRGWRIDKARCRKADWPQLLGSYCICSHMPSWWLGLTWCFLPPKIYRIYSIYRSPIQKTIGRATRSEPPVGTRTLVACSGRPKSDGTSPWAPAELRGCSNKARILSNKIDEHIQLSK